MTTPTRREPWDDERLKAAFAARASRASTPVEVVAATRAALRSQPQRTPLWRRLMAPTPAAALVLVVVLATGGLAMLVNSDRTAPGTSPDGSTPGPTTLPTPSETPTVGPPTPEAVLGLPVVSVTDAIAIRGTGADDREMAVHGWYAPFFPTRACGKPDAEQPVSPLQADCPEDRFWLMQDPEPVISVTDPGLSWRGPTGPAINPAFGEIDMSWAQPIDDPARLVELVVVGHFDDRRSVACPPAEERACRDRFVVDRVERVNGLTQPLSVVDLIDHGPFHNPEEILGIVEREAPAGAVLSMVLVDGTSGIERVEPTLGRGFDGTTHEIAIWVVRVLDSGRLSTYLVIDGEDRTYRVDPSGVAVLVEGQPAQSATPAVTARPTPFEPATVTFQMSGDHGPVPFDVLDRTELLEDAREATTDELALPWDEPEVETLTIENLRPDTILARWSDVRCQRHPRITIEPDSTSAGRPRRLHLTDTLPGCDLLPAHRGVVLRFSVDVDAGDLIGTKEMTLIE